MSAEIDEEIATLLAEPLDRFVEARTARVKELKAAGLTDAAAALAKIRKPSRVVWHLVDLGRRHPDEGAAAVTAADDLESAQSGGGGDVRGRLDRFREAIGTLTRVGDDPSLGLALRSVLADREARQAWADGRLLVLPQAGRPDTAIPEAPKQSSESEPRLAERRARRDAVAEVGDQGDGHRSAVVTGEDEVSSRRAKREARREAEAADTARRRAREAVQIAEREWQTAEDTRAALAREVDDLEQRIADLQIDLDRARDRLETAEGAEADASRRVDEAREGLD